MSLSDLIQDLSDPLIKRIMADFPAIPMTNRLDPQNFVPIFLGFQGRSGFGDEGFSRSFVRGNGEMFLLSGNRLSGRMDFDVRCVGFGYGSRSSQDGHSISDPAPWASTTISW